MEYPIDTVLVVSGGEDLRYNELAAACHNGGVVSEIGMLKEDTRILLMYTDGIVDGDCSASTVAELGIQVVDHTFAVTTKTKSDVSFCLPLPTTGTYERELVMYPPPYSPRSNACLR